MLGASDRMGPERLGIAPVGGLTPGDGGQREHRRADTAASPHRSQAAFEMIAVTDKPATPSRPGRSTSRSGSGRCSGRPAALSADRQEADDRHQHSQKPEPAHGHVGPPAPAADGHHGDRHQQEARSENPGHRQVGARMRIKSGHVDGEKRLPQVGSVRNHRVGKPLGQRQRAIGLVES